MFNNLVESDLHTADFKRRSSFLFGTMLVYALLLMIAGVGSIYAYEARVDNQSLELTALVTMLPTTAAPPRVVPEHNANCQPRAASTDETALVPVRTVNQSNVTDMRKTPIDISVTGNNVPPSLPNAVIGPRNLDVGGFGDPGRSSSNGGGGTGGATTGSNGGNELTRDAPPELPGVVNKPTRPILISIGVIESKVTHKAIPPYPELAKRAHASGQVVVQILLDEQGHVVSAHATSGHPLLRAAAEQAAYQTRFSPTLLSNQPVKVTGVITFNFVLQ